MFTCRRFCFSLPLCGLLLGVVACSGSGNDGVTRQIRTADAGEEDVDAESDTTPSDEPAEEDAGSLPEASTESDASLPPASGGCSAELNAAATEHSATVTSDETWGPGLHLVKFHTSVRKGATLTIAPCAVVRVRAGQGIDLWEGATLVAEGSMSQPIRFEPELAGNTWAVFQVAAGATLRLAHVSITAAGTLNDSSAGALSLRGTPEQPVARVRHVTISAAPRFGVRLESGAAFTPDSEDLTVTGAGEFPVISHPSGVGSLPLGKYTGNAHDEIMITEGEVQRDMTWRDLGVPYHVGRIGVTTSVRVAASLLVPAPRAVPLLTIEAGVVLRFEPTSVMEIEHFTSPNPASGALRVLGTAARPVVFTSAAAVPAAGDWIGLWFGGIPDPRNLIDHARVEYAGGNAFSQNHSCDNPVAPMANATRAAVLVLGQPQSSFITNTSIAHSASNAIQRGWFGTPVDFLPSNSFTDVAWCLQSYPRPVGAACPTPVPCPR